MQRMLLLVVTSLVAFSRAQTCFEYNIDYDGIDIDDGLHNKTNTPEECQALCQKVDRCEGFTWATDNFFGKLNSFLFIHIYLEIGMH